MIYFNCLNMKLTPFFCSNINIVKVLAELGSGIDAVSAGKVYRAIQGGIRPEDIVFAGVGKTKDEMRYALENGVEEFSVESIPEMIALNEVALDLGKKAKFSLRVNPDIDAKTHDKISTGRKEDKFGVNINHAKEIYDRAAKLKGLEIYGISTHIGSQITDIKPFKDAFTKLRELFIELKKDYDLKSLDFGGGVGISYDNEKLINLDDYAKLIKDLTHDLNVKITIAPGRSIIGDAAILVTEVIYIKETDHKKFAIIDAAMNDLMRPGLYDAYHQIIQVRKKEENEETYEVVGPVCESTDILGKKRIFQNLQAGDLLAICNAGAYGASLSNEYNSRPLIPEILINDNQSELIRKRPDFQDMIELER